MNRKLMFVVVFVLATALLGLAHDRTSTIHPTASSPTSMTKCGATVDRPLLIKQGARPVNGGNVAVYSLGDLAQMDRVQTGFTSEATFNGSETIAAIQGCSPDGKSSFLDTDPHHIVGEGWCNSQGMCILKGCANLVVLAGVPEQAELVPGFMPQPQPQPVAAPLAPPAHDECANLEGIQSRIPEGMLKDSSGECFAPAPAPSAPTKVKKDHSTRNLLIAGGIGFGVGYALCRAHVLCPDGVGMQQQQQQVVIYPPPVPVKPPTVVVSPGVVSNGGITTTPGFVPDNSRQSVASERSSRSYTSDNNSAGSLMLAGLNATRR